MGCVIVVLIPKCLLELIMHNKDINESALDTKNPDGQGSWLDI